jgi:predicted Zn-dependent peptidase
MASGAIPRRAAGARRPRPAPPPPYERTVLPNGLRVITQSMPHARSVSVGLFVGVGSRHEDAAHAGLSHLLEHLVFKGTRAYPAPGEVSEAIESVGGSVNASTDRELTVYSSKVPAAHAGRALDIVAELVARPLLRHADLSAEKPVIVDEIRMYVDSPGDHVFTMFDELLFGSHPLGREIAGTPRSVRRATHAAALEHWARWYRPEHVVVAVAGAIDHAAVLDAARGWWTDAGAEATGVAARRARHARRIVPFGRPRPVDAGAMRVLHRDLAQGNLCLGMPGVARDDPDRWALDMLGAVLGDGMSSRLFLELRERRSLAYDVSTFATSYADCGTFGVHAGFDPDQAEEVVAAVANELDRIASEPVQAHELERARAYTRGRLELRMEDTGAVASWLGTGESLLPRILTVDEVVDRLDAVTADDLLRVARRWVRPGLARLAVLGPFRGRSRFTRALHRWISS